MSVASLVVVALAVIAVAVGSVSWRTRRRRAAARERAVRDLPGVVSDIARSVRGGATLELAVRDVAPNASGVLRQELQGVIALLERGHGTDRVLGLWSRATRIDGVDLVVAAARFPLGSGTGLDRALEGVAATLLDRIEVRDEVVALASQARTSTAVLLALPPAGAVVFTLVDPTYSEVLLGSAAGRVCLLLGVLLEVAGARTSRVLVERSLREPGRDSGRGALGAAR